VQGQSTPQPEPLKKSPLRRDKRKIQVGGGRVTQGGSRNGFSGGKKKKGHGKVEIGGELERKGWEKCFRRNDVELAIKMIVCRP